MKNEVRVIFIQWYEEHKHEQVDMQQDLVDYCVSHVEILTAARFEIHRTDFNNCRRVSFYRSYYHCVGM